MRQQGHYHSQAERTLMIWSWDEEWNKRAAVLAEHGMYNPADEHDDEPTDVKLAMLSSLHPDAPQDMLLEFLLAHEGSVSEASAALKLPDSFKRPPSGVMGAQSSLLRYGMGLSDIDPDQPTKKRLMSKKGATLHLYDPADIAEHTPCSIIHNFLPPDEANDLLRELLDEAKTYVKATFKLFDNVVSSRHIAPPREVRRAAVVRG